MGFLALHIEDLDARQALGRAVARALDDPESETRRFAVNFFRPAPGFPGSGGLIEALLRRGAQFDGVPLPGTSRDLGYELRECIEVQLIGRADDSLLDAVERALDAGTGTVGLLMALGRHRPHSVVARAAALAATSAGWRAGRTGRRPGPTRRGTRRHPLGRAQTAMTRQRELCAESRRRARPARPSAA